MTPVRCHVAKARHIANAVIHANPGPLLLPQQTDPADPASSIYLYSLFTLPSRSRFSPPWRLSLSLDLFSDVHRSEPQRTTHTPYYHPVTLKLTPNLAPSINQPLFVLDNSFPTPSLPSISTPFPSFFPSSSHPHFFLPIFFPRCAARIHNG